MSREVRKVPSHWDHPRDSRGDLKPLFDEDYATACAEWKAGYEKWETEPSRDCEYWEWHGNPPREEYYRPAWTDAERTHYQMYETTSEGTPISPVMGSLDALARWLADNRASAFWGMTATYEQWLGMCRVGSSVAPLRWARRRVPVRRLRPRERSRR